MVRPGLLLAAGLVLALPAGAAAEIVYLTTGRTLSVRAHRVEGDAIVLVLRSGGTITCPRSLVLTIEPDEVPYPEDPEGEPSGESIPGAAGAAIPALVDRLAAAHGVDPRLVHAVVTVESGYRPAAVSPKGAMGLMQLMPATARRYAVADPFDPGANLDAGIRHLKTLLERFALPVALAAYNAGEGAVERFGGIPPYAETRDYVRQVLSLLERR